MWNCGIPGYSGDSGNGIANWDAPGLYNDITAQFNSQQYIIYVASPYPQISKYKYKKEVVCAPANLPNPSRHTSHVAQ